MHFNIDQQGTLTTFARTVPNSDIAENEYNLAVSSYVEQENTAEEVNIRKTQRPNCRK